MGGAWAESGASGGWSGCWTTSDGRESLLSVSLAEWPIARYALPKNFEGDGMGLLDWVEGRVSLVAHVCEGWQAAGVVEVVASQELGDRSRCAAAPWMLVVTRGWGDPPSPNADPGPMTVPGEWPAERGEQKVYHTKW